VELIVVVDVVDVDVVVVDVVVVDVVVVDVVDVVVDRRQDAEIMMHIGHRDGFGRVD
jgi:hypothetical protein